jgi:peptide/nickel transport system substrate-binding protein
MKRFSKFFMLGLALALVSALVLPAVAQEEAPGAGLGGTVVESTIGDDASTFNPILSNDTVSSLVIARMYPDIIGLDPATLDIAPNVDQALATGWEYDETGTVLTLNLREDAFWADGTPITADDYLYAFNAVKSGQTSSPRTYVMYELDDGTVTEGFIHEVVAVDDYTLEFTMGLPVRDDDGNIVRDDEGNIELAVACDAIYDINDISVVPAHIFESEFGDDYAAMDADPYFVPRGEGDIAATFGAFTDPFIEFGVQISLLADQNYPDTDLDFVSPGEWLLQNVENQTIEYERFLAGDFTFIGVAPANQNEMRANPDFETTEWSSLSYAYMGYNLADPTNPQPSVGEGGELIDQGNHPIFGDVRVRQAIAYAVNVEEMIGTRPEGDNPATGILEGNGYPIATNTSPYSSTNDELEELGVEPYPYNPELAMELLEEAGWVDTDDDGVRECDGCLYAEPGSELEFELLTNAGNVARESIGETIRAQLTEVGFVVNFQAIEFGTLVDELLGQEFDALIIGWSLGAPFLPGGTLKSFYGTAADLPGSGFNYVSFQNEEFDDLVERADGLPAAEDGSYEACDPAQRDLLYAEAQQILWEEQPYLWLYTGNTMVAAQNNVQNFDPFPNATRWNLDAWYIADE